MRMNDYMDTLDITVAEMSGMTGIDRSVLHSYRMGRATPTAPVLRRLVMSTGFSADWWLGL